MREKDKGTLATCREDRSSGIDQAKLPKDLELPVWLVVQLTGTPLSPNDAIKRHYALVYSKRREF